MNPAQDQNRKPQTCPRIRTFASRWGLAAGLVCVPLLQSCLSPDKLEGNRPQSAENQLAVALSTVPSGYTDVAIASGLSNPTQMEFAPDGRAFVSEQGGRLRVIKNGTLLSTPFLTVSVSTTGERGLLGIAFDPNFAAEKFVYVMYTSPSGPHNKVSRFTVSGSNADVADAASEKVLLDLPSTLCSCGWHNGGGVHFGKDGKLYVSVGESTVGSRAQDLGTTMGKVLRINKDGSIPGDNPFYSQTSGSNRSIFAMGFRNPYTFAVQPGTGRIFVNDVGNTSFEEIDDLQAGKNYGWPAKDGVIGDARYVDPYYTYSHGSGCAISGGSFYNPATVRFPSDFVGDYFFSDYCGNWIKKLDVASKSVTTFVTGINQPTDVKVGNDGNLYYVARGAGEVRKVSSNSSQAPAVSDQPKSLTVAAGAPAAFSVSASGAAPLAYQWQRNQANISGATSPGYSLASASLSDNGARFRCVVRNASGSAASNEAVLTVLNNHAPVATITQPATGTLYSGGSVIRFAGKGADQEDGNLAASRLAWEVRFFHNDGNLHYHPFMALTSGIASGSFTVPAQSETSPNVWFRIYLTATDAAGLKDMDSLDVNPNKVTVTLNSNPTGLQVMLDGMAHAAPYAFTGVAGIQRSLGAVSPQSLGGKTYAFSTWSDGGAATHNVLTPSANAAYSAVYKVGSTVLLEAEDAAFSGPSVVANHPGFTGNGYLDFQHANGDWVEWTVDAAAAGTRTLGFHYANGDGTAIKVKVTVNGSLVDAGFTLASTGAWTVWGNANLTANLAAGANKVRMTSINAGQPNIDNCAVNP